MAERLREDELRVWLDEWETPLEVLLADRIGEGLGLLSPGAPGVTAAKIEAGLEHSRVLVLCMSAHAFGSDAGAPGLEADTFFLSRPAEPASPLHSPAARRRPNQRLPGAISAHRLAAGELRTLLAAKLSGGRILKWTQILRYVDDTFKA